MVKKYADLYLQTRSALLPTEGERAAFIARELLACAADKTVEQVLANRELYASEQVEARLNELLERARRGEPLAYLIGQWDFHGMTLKVTQDVLIPRDDTEAVAELAIRTVKHKLPQTPRVLDLCAGSGCIGLAIAREVPDARVTLGDLSERALRIARFNTAAQHLSGRVHALLVDAKKPAAPFLGKFDLIVSNPPYVTTAELKRLDTSVKEFEPEMALDGGEDGLDFYRAILQNFHSALKPGGWLAFEFGMGQADAVCELLQQHGFAVIERKEDLSGTERAVLAQDTREERD